MPEPKPILEERFNFASAFRVTPATGGIAVGMLVVLVAIRCSGWCGSSVATGATRARRSTSRSGSEVPNTPEERVPLLGEDETPVEFVPPDGLRPGQVGTLVDFKANPLDVTATIVDLAVRGYLKIEELHEERSPAQGDWKLTRTTAERRAPTLSCSVRAAAARRAVPRRRGGAALRPAQHVREPDAKVPRVAAGRREERGWFATERSGSCAFGRCWAS